MHGVVIRRPSARNKSPYVGDVRLEDGCETLAHMPSLDMGGKCVAGTQVLLKRARDKKGNPLPADAVGKYGTPKCQYILQLLKCVEPENEGEGGVWIGAHPSIGETLADEMIRRGVLAAELGALAALEREVTAVAGTDMRCDFFATSEAGARSVIEVKTVVDTDYDPATAPQRAGCVFVGKGDPYKRAAIFPWARKCSQIGPDGEKVVSARAIKHVCELTSLATGERTLDGGERVGAVMLFVVTRADAQSFRANAEACPSFAKHLARASRAGVKVVAHRVRWGTGPLLGKALYDGAVPFEPIPL